MSLRIRSVALYVLFAVALGLMWFQAFELTGVTADVVPPGADRPAPPPAPELSSLPTSQANIDLFASAHQVWSGISY
jgi:hypothetical protein